MPKGLLRLGDTNIAGGAITAAACDPTVLVNGRPIALAGGPVSPHEKHPVSYLQFVAGTILVNGRPAAVYPSVDSCGHARVTGSIDVSGGS